MNEAKHKAQLIPELEKAETKFKTIKTNAFGKTINYGNGVSIDTDDVMYIEKGANIHTYTFYINRENAPADAPLENLVLSNLPDGTYRELLVSYNFTLQEKQMLENGIPVDSKGKVAITELAQGTYNNGEMMTESTLSCNWVSETLWNPCSEGLHDGTNANECAFIKDFTKGTPPTAYVVMNYKCQLIASTALGDDGTGGGSGPQNGPGGLGNEEPEIPTIPIIPGGPKSNNTDPCKKTKTLLEDPVVKEKIKVLEEQSKKTGSDKGEKAFLYMNDNVSSGIIGGGDHEVDLTGYYDYKGIYHNHTPYGTKMLAPYDIRALYRTIVYKMTSAVSPKEAFVGMVAYETCNCPPDNFIYHNYVLRFNGDISNTGAIANLSKEEIQKYRDDYGAQEMKLLKNPSLRTGSIFSNLNAQGLEQLFFKTLANMNIDPNQIVLQKIEKDGTINNINLNSDGTTTPVPCPK